MFCINLSLPNIIISPITFLLYYYIVFFSSSNSLFLKDEYSYKKNFLDVVTPNVLSMDLDLYNFD